MVSKWVSVPSSKDDKLSKDSVRNELKQGEICLYEKEGLTQYAMFKLSAKYMLYHGTRVSFFVLRR